MKRDRQAHKTGNLFIECDSGGASSGIVTTEAKFWIFVVDDASGRMTSFFGAEVSTLKEKIKGRRLVSGGTSNHGFLVPMSAFLGAQA